MGYTTSFTGEIEIKQQRFVAGSRHRGGKVARDEGRAR